MENHCPRDMGRDVADVFQPLQMHSPTYSSKEQEGTTI